MMTISKDAQSWSCKGCRQEIEAGEYGWLTEDIIQELKALEAEGEVTYILHQSALVSDKPP